MKNAAMVLGIIGGIVGMIVGFFGYGFTEAVQWLADWVGGVSPHAAANLSADADRTEIKLISLFAPILGIAGGAMAPSHRLLGAAFLAGSAWGMFHGFGFGVFTMFPIAMCGLAALLAALSILSRRENA